MMTRGDQRMPSVESSVLESRSMYFRFRTSTELEATESIISSTMKPLGEKTLQSPFASYERLEFRQNLQDTLQWNGTRSRTRHRLCSHLLASIVCLNGVGAALFKTKALDSSISCKMQDPGNRELSSLSACEFGTLE